MLDDSWDESGSFDARKSFTKKSSTNRLSTVGNDIDLHSKPQKSKLSRRDSNEIDALFSPGGSLDSIEHSHEEVKPKKTYNIDPVIPDVQPTDYLANFAQNSFDMEDSILGELLGGGSKPKKDNQSLEPLKSETTKAPVVEKSFPRSTSPPKSFKSSTFKGDKSHDFDSPLPSPHHSNKRERKTDEEKAKPNQFTRSRSSFASLGDFDSDSDYEFGNNRNKNKTTVKDTKSVEVKDNMPNISNTLPNPRLNTVRTNSLADLLDDSDDDDFQKPVQNPTNKSIQNPNDLKPLPVGKKQFNQEKDDKPEFEKNQFSKPIKTEDENPKMPDLKPATSWDFGGNEGEVEKEKDKKEGFIPSFLEPGRQSRRRRNLDSSGARGSFDGEGNNSFRGSNNNKLDDLDAALGFTPAVSNKKAVYDPFSSVENKIPSINAEKSKSIANSAGLKGIVSDSDSSDSDILSRRRSTRYDRKDPFKPPENSEKDTKNPEKSNKLKLDTLPSPEFNKVSNDSSTKLSSSSNLQSPNSSSGKLKNKLNPNHPSNHDLTNLKSLPAIKSLSGSFQGSPGPINPVPSLRVAENSDDDELDVSGIVRIDVEAPSFISKPKKPLGKSSPSPPKPISKSQFGGDPFSSGDSSRDVSPTNKFSRNRVSKEEKDRASNNPLTSSVEIKDQPQTFFGGEKDDLKKSDKHGFSFGSEKQLYGRTKDINDETENNENLQNAGQNIHEETQKSNNKKPAITKGRSGLESILDFDDDDDDDDGFMTAASNNTKEHKIQKIEKPSLSMKNPSSFNQEKDSENSVEILINQQKQAKKEKEKSLHSNLENLKSRLSSNNDENTRNYVNINDNDNNNVRINAPNLTNVLKNGQDWEYQRLISQLEQEIYRLKDEAIIKSSRHYEEIKQLNEKHKIDLQETIKRKDFEIESNQQRHIELIESMKKIHKNEIDSYKDRANQMDQFEAISGQLRTTSGSIQFIETQLQIQQRGLDQAREGQLSAREQLLQEMEAKARERAELAEQEGHRLKGILSYMEQMAEGMRNQSAEEKQRLHQEHTRLKTMLTTLESEKNSLQNRNMEEIAYLKQRSKEIEIELINLKNEKQKNLEEIMSEHRRLEKAKESFNHQMDNERKELLQREKEITEDEKKLKKMEIDLLSEKRKFDERYNHTIKEIQNIEIMQDNVMKAREKLDEEKKQMQQIILEFQFASDEMMKKQHLLDEQQQAIEQKEMSLREGYAQMKMASTTLTKREKEIHDRLHYLEQQRVQLGVLDRQMLEKRVNSAAQLREWSNVQSVAWIQNRLNSVPNSITGFNPLQNFGGDHQAGDIDLDNPMSYFPPPAPPLSEPYLNKSNQNNNSQNQNQQHYQNDNIYTNETSIPVHISGQFDPRQLSDALSQTSTSVKMEENGTWMDQFQQKLRESLNNRNIGSYTALILENGNLEPNLDSNMSYNNTIPKELKLAQRALKEARGQRNGVTSRATRVDQLLFDDRDFLMEIQQKRHLELGNL